MRSHMCHFRGFPTGRLKFGKGTYLPPGLGEGGRLYVGVGDWLIRQPARGFLFLERYLSSYPGRTGGGKDGGRTETLFEPAK